MVPTIAIVLAVAGIAISAPARQYPLRLQPELDSVDVEAYIKNDRLFNLQLKCLFDESPCDVVGRWLKPRVAQALLGNCPKCTPIQEKKIERVLSYVQDEKPDIYRALFVKFIQDHGVEVDDSEKEKLQTGLNKLEEQADEDGDENIADLLDKDDIPLEMTKP